jgi:hypothetical protein
MTPSSKQQQQQQQQYADPEATIHLVKKGRKEKK